MDFQFSSYSQAAKFHDSRIVWIAVAISLLTHCFALVWWPVSRSTAEHVLTAVNEFNIELINLIPRPELEPEPVPAPAPVPVETLIPDSVENLNIGAVEDTQVANSEEAEEGAQPLRIDSLAIQEVISSMDLSTSLDRAVPANELQLRGGSVSSLPGTEMYWSTQGDRVIVMDGYCMVIPMLADNITHQKQVSFLSGAGCPYTPSQSEEMAKNILERVCAKFECE